MQAFGTPEVPLHDDKHGVIRVGRSRVSLESVVAAFGHGASAEEIVERERADTVEASSSTS